MKRERLNLTRKELVANLVKVAKETEVDVVANEVEIGDYYKVQGSEGELICVTVNLHKYMETIYGSEVDYNDCLEAKGDYIFKVDPLSTSELDRDIDDFYFAPDDFLIVLQGEEFAIFRGGELFSGDAEVEFQVDPDYDSISFKGLKEEIVILL